MQLQSFIAGINSAQVFCGRVMIGDVRNYRVTGETENHKKLEREMRIGERRHERREKR